MPLPAAHARAHRPPHYPPTPTPLTLFDPPWIVFTVVWVGLVCIVKLACRHKPVGSIARLEVPITAKHHREAFCKPQRVLGSQGLHAHASTHPYPCRPQPIIPQASPYVRPHAMEAFTSAFNIRIQRKARARVASNTQDDSVSQTRCCSISVVPMASRASEAQSAHASDHTRLNNPRTVWTTINFWL